MKNKNLVVHDMVHNNPGMVPYESAYQSPEFLKERGYDGKVFDLFSCAQYGLLWDQLDRQNPDREKVFEEGSKDRLWVLEKKREYKEKYGEMKQAGLQVMAMMDVIVLPKRIGVLYPEILDADGKIDIQAPKMKEILDVLFEEMFQEFPEISGIYIRFGETYVGEKYGTPYHFGNHPIRMPEEGYHLFLIRYLKETVCRKYQRNLYYRTWGFGKIQYDPEYYLKIAGEIETDPKFFFCIKHTAGDFHRDFLFNQCLNKGQHRQIVEIQAAREYEGKGAYPNYIGNGIINGYEEFKWLMEESQTHCLKDVVNTEDSRIAGIWIWSRGGGWDGPYINGRNGKQGEVLVEEGCELWADVNAYVMAKWAKDPSHSDRYYALQYARDVLHMSRKDAEIFYEILMLSERAVLLGRGTNLSEIAWDVFWTRDQNIDYPSMLSNLISAKNSQVLEALLEEKRRSVEIWEAIVKLASRLEEDLNMKSYIVTTCKYGYYLYSLYEVMYRANAYALSGGFAEKIKEALQEYEDLWEQWEQLKQNGKGCPTLYARRNEKQDLIGYNWNTGFDGAMEPLQDLEEDGKLKKRYLDKIPENEEWGLRKD